MPDPRQISDMQVFQILERYSGFCFALATMLGFVAGDLLYAEEPLKTDAVNSRPNIVLIMSDDMDQGIGRILDQLESTGDLDNTLIFFLQDNGGCAEGVGRKDNGSGLAICSHSVATVCNLASVLRCRPATVGGFAQGLR